ncbi:hypothetical protein BWI93_05140 [Siphonobacter sp. BAB-5385]|uniref:toll/interleukin-1 receptor domain-containing protein n=1 Tax=Siphonobacter sp. BAB-5385 TaxID=1864822 RepID=UPI000B9EAE7A|nr:toll/interleukin-1 receptor domain-containing protein [Siphonobacter sp. BAB-5385]OZI09191.1 hypothetical protein BWI93_05140 [Siphonobacter sp. BAB-5385]
MKKYKIFISFNSNESKLAKAIHNVVNDYFDGQVVTFFTEYDLLGGDKWKEKIRKNLEDCDAILLVLTSKYAERPWAYVEWSAFWLQNKDIYVLFTDDVKINELISPMQDDMLTRLFDETAVKNLFRKLKLKSGFDGPAPLGAAEELASGSKKIYENLVEESKAQGYKIYEDVDLLPNDDSQKLDILKYFYYKEKNAFIASKILKKIDDGLIKRSVLIEFLENGDEDFVDKNFDSIANKTTLVRLLIKYIELDKTDSPTLYKIISSVSARQTALRTFAEYLIDSSIENEKLLDFVVNQFSTWTELKGALKYAITNSKVNTKLFHKFYQKLVANSNSEWKNVLMEIVKYKEHKVFL